MELHHLRYFVAVAEERHFGRAAARLHVTQPPVSQRIRDLERELELELFQRSPRGIQLTEAGAALLAHARRVLREVDLAVRAMNQLSKGPESQLRVGLPPDTSPATIRVTLQEFSARVPDVGLQIAEMTTSEQLELLRAGELDVAVVRRPADGVGLESSATVVSPVGVWMSAADPLAGRDDVLLSELEDRALITFPREMAPATYDQILATCRDGGFLPSFLHHVYNPQFMRGIIESGLGVYLNSHDTFEGDVEGAVFRPLRGTPLAWQSSVVWLPQRRTETTEAFVDAALAGLMAGGYRLPEQGDAQLVDPEPRG